MTRKQEAEWLNDIFGAKGVVMWSKSGWTVTTKLDRSGPKAPEWDAIRARFDKWFAEVIAWYAERRNAPSFKLVGQTQFHGEGMWWAVEFNVGRIKEA